MDNIWMSCGISVAPHVKLGTVSVITLTPEIYQIQDVDAVYDKFMLKTKKTESALKSTLWFLNELPER